MEIKPKFGTREFNDLAQNHFSGKPKSMEGKEIKQQEALGNVIINPDSKGNIEIKQHWGNREREIVIVAPNKVREVALAICPELHSELEILKTRTALGDLAAQNCVRLEKELEKAKELFKYLLDVNGIVHESDADKVYTFLEGSGNKTK